MNEKNRALSTADLEPGSLGGQKGRARAYALKQKTDARIQVHEAGKGASVRKLDGLEVIRALAALMVVVAHAIYYRLAPSNSFTSLFTSFGTEAVIIFFVLSGVVITLSAQSRSPSAQPLQAGRFMWLRFVKFIRFSLSRFFRLRSRPT